MQAAPLEWEVNVETGSDFRAAYARVDEHFLATVPVDGATQATYAPTLGMSVMLRIPALRAYYGLRLEGHYATTEAMEEQVFSEPLVRTGDTYTAAVLANYKAFLFDMEGDCDCPRWDKTNFFKKAFFVEFGAGYGRQSFSTEGIDARVDRAGFAYRAGLGISIRLQKQWDVYLAAAGHGLIGPENPIGSHSIGVRPALGITWRPYYNRF